MGTVKVPASRSWRLRARALMVRAVAMVRGMGSVERVQSPERVFIDR